MRRDGTHRHLLALAGAAGLVGLAVVGLVGPGAWGGLAGRAAAQPERGVGTLPGEAVVPLPTELQNPADRPDRWVFADPRRPTVLEAEGPVTAIDGTELLLGGPDRLEEVTAPEIPLPDAGTAIELAGDTTYYVEGRPTTFDRIPLGVPARVTYQLLGERRVALRVEVLEGAPAPPLPEPVP